MTDKNKYYKDNAENKKEYQRNYRLNHPEYKEKNKEYRENNKEKSRQYVKKYREDNRERYLENKRKSNLKHKYGITIDEYNEIFEKQKGCCAICNTHQSELKKALCVDHNHETGEIRGLLCDRCNRVLGFFNDETPLFIQSILYLNKRS